ncbi:transaldolase family protein [Streptomyces sp. NPDC000410]|uniref:transaldolase family protein n=1 Tax=Streptomyces sp. NPDC000410 TaxID=3154254 RepID=UPI00332F57C7
MISAQAGQVLEELAAEGVRPWLAWPDARPPGPDVVRHGFHGVAMPPGAPLSAVRAACDALLGAGAGGTVTVAVAAPDPGAAGDADAWVAAARMLRVGVDRPNLMVGVPATKAGTGAVADCLAEGIGVNSTSVFSVEQYRAVLDAQLTGLERALANGMDLAGLVTAASFALGPLDAEVNARLDRLPGGAGHALRDTAGLATARLAHRMREERLADEWWRVLRVGGARPPMLMWTETGPAHVAALVGWNTVHVMTADTVEAAAVRGGLGGDTLLGQHEWAARTLRDLAAKGVEVGRVAEGLAGGT